MEQPLTQPANLQTPGMVTPSPRSKTFLVLLFLLCVLFFSVVLVFAYERFIVPFLTPREPVPVVSPFPSWLASTSPSAQPVSDIPTDWKTYINTSYNYSIKYPPDWKVEGEGGEDLSKAFAPYINSPCNFQSGDRCANIVLSLEGGYKPDEDLEYYFNIGSDIHSHISPQDIISKKEITVSGEKGLEIKYRLSKIYTGHEKEPAIEIHAVHNNQDLLIQYGEQQNTNFTEFKYEDIFDQILSSFKFLDSTLLPSSNP